MRPCIAHGSFWPLQHVYDFAVRVVCGVPCVQLRCTRCVDVRCVGELLRCSRCCWMVVVRVSVCGSMCGSVRNMSHELWPGGAEAASQCVSASTERRERARQKHQTRERPNRRSDARHAPRGRRACRAAQPNEPAKASQLHTPHTSPHILQEYTVTRVQLGSYRAWI